MAKLIKYRFCIFILILILGIFYRVKPLFVRGMWVDEVCVFYLSQLPLKKIILMDHWDQAHPQFVYMLMHFWQKISTNLVFLRLPSLMFGIASIVLVYLITKSFRNISFALLSTALFSIATWFIGFSFQFKTYSLVIFLILSSIYFILKFFSSGKK